MRFSVTDLAAAVVALGDFADRDFAELSDHDVTVAHEAAALVRNLAEVPLAVASRTLSERSSLNARRSGHQS
ncbi:hypothetical protein, partial [Demequina sp.]|uniref:hypothetical protein n=1 Tax=Demequina sp. TaxID=2050685 RepID=UPI0025DF143D